MIAAMYVAYFNRAPNLSGLGWWEEQFRTGQSETDISRGFSLHPQFQLEYGALDSRGFVEKLYLNMLGNVGDASGIDYWAARLDGAEQLLRSDMVAEFVRGVLEIDLEVIRNQLSDAEYAAARERQDKLWNKVEAARYFADTLAERTELKPANESGNTLDRDMAYQASINILREVGDDPASLERAKATIDAIRSSSDYAGLLEDYANVIGASSGQTSYKGTTGNDLFRTVYSAMHGDNSLAMGTESLFDGGSGFDVLEITIDSVPAAASLSVYPQSQLDGIEQVRIHVTPTMQSNNQDVHLGIGEADVVVTGQTAAGSGLTLVSQNSLMPDIQLLDTNASVSLLPAGYGWASRNEAVKVTLDGYNASWLSFGASLAAVDLFAYNQESSISSTIYDVSRFTLSGDADLRLAVGDGTLFDASAYTGNLRLNHDGWFGRGDVLLGSGDDWLEVSALRDDRTVDGSAGRDTLVLDSAAYTAIQTQGASNFEEIRLSVGSGVSAVDAQLIVGVDTLWLSQDWFWSQSKVVAVERLASWQTLGLLDALSVSVVRPDTVADAALNVRLDSVGDAYSYGTLEAEGHDVILLSSVGTARNRLALAGDSLERMNVSGIADLELASLPGTIEVDATGFKANLSLVAATGSLQFQGGSGDDWVDLGATLDSTDILRGGDGFDTLMVSDIHTLRSASAERVTGFEALELTGANTTVDLAQLPVLDQVVLNSGSAAFSLRGLSADTTLVLKQPATVSVGLAENTAADTLRITSLTRFVGTLDAAGYERVELDVQVASSSYSQTGYLWLKYIGVESELVLRGGDGQKFSLYSSDGSSGNLARVDASGFDGSLNLSLNYGSGGKLEVVGTSGNDEFDALGWNCIIDAGAGDDRFEFTHFNNHHVVTGGGGSDVFVFQAPNLWLLTKLVITDLDLGTSLSSVDLIEVQGSYVRGSSLTDAQINIYAGGDAAALADSRVLVLTDAMYANTTAVVEQIRNLGVQSDFLTVFWADQNERVHLGSLDYPNATSGLLSDLAEIENLSILGVAQNLDYTDFV